jgi:hypothetical protein
MPILLNIMPEYIIQLSIYRIVPYSDTLYRYHRVLRVSSLTLSVVVCRVPSAIGIIPCVICNQSVPQLVRSCSCCGQSANEAGREVGFEKTWVKVDIDKVKTRIVMLKVEALEVAVIPGIVGIGNSSLDSSLHGSVPILVILEEIAVRERNDEEDNCQ